MTNNLKCYEQFEDRMFIAWCLFDLTNCVRCKAKIKLYYQWHYSLLQVMELTT